MSGEILTNSLIERINSLNTIFEQPEVLEKHYPIVDEQIDNSAIENVQDSLVKTTNHMEKIIDILTLEILGNDDLDEKTKLIDSFSNIANSLSTSLKSLSSSMETIEKIRKSKITTPESKNNTGVYIDKMVVNNEISPISTTDIIAKLRVKSDSSEA